ncbi:unnamed protein product, partial [Closterium sp. NIES-53]
LPPMPLAMAAADLLGPAATNSVRGGSSATTTTRPCPAHLSPPPPPPPPPPSPATTVCSQLPSMPYHAMPCSFAASGYCTHCLPPTTMG